MFLCALVLLYSHHGRETISCLAYHHLKKGFVVVTTFLLIGRKLLAQLFPFCQDTCLIVLHKITSLNPLILGCVAGSILLRKAATAAFASKRRATLTTDIIEFLGPR